MRYIALLMFAVVLTQCTSSRQPAGPEATPQAGSAAVQGMEATVDQCPNAAAIKRLIPNASAALADVQYGTPLPKGVNQVGLARDAARAFYRCARASKFPFTKDWATYNYAYWLEHSATGDAYGLTVLQQTDAVLAKLESETRFDMVRVEIPELRDRIKNDEARVQQILNNATQR